MKKRRSEPCCLTTLPTSLISHILSHAGILENIQVSRCSHNLHSVATRRESASYNLEARFATYSDCQNHLAGVLSKCGKHTQLHIHVIEKLRSNTLRELVTTLCDIPQLCKLELNVFFDTPVSPVGTLSSLTALKLRRTFFSFFDRRIEPENLDFAPPQSLLEYDDCCDHEPTTLLARLPTTLIKLRLPLWRSSMLRFVSLEQLHLAIQMDRLEFVNLANTLVHLRRLSFFGLNEPLDITTSVVFPNLTEVVENLYVGRNDIWARSLPFIETPKLEEWKTTTMFTPTFPMRLARFPFVTKVTIFGDSNAFVELTQPGSLPASCISLHLIAPTDVMLCFGKEFTIPTVDMLDSLGFSLPKLHTLVLDVDTQLHGTRALTWVRTLEITNMGSGGGGDGERLLDFTSIVPNLTTFRSPATRQGYPVLLPSLRTLQNLQIIDTPMMALNAVGVSQMYNVSKDVNKPFPSLYRMHVGTFYGLLSSSYSNLEVVVNNGSPFRNENSAVHLS